MGKLPQVPINRLSLHLLQVEGEEKRSHCTANKGPTPCFGDSAFCGLQECHSDLIADRSALAADDSAFLFSDACIGYTIATFAKNGHWNSKCNPQGPGGAGMATVLLVDDEDAIREIVQCVLERQGYRVIPASDAVQALELSDDHCGQSIDLLLTDIELPGMKGSELARVICAKRAQTKVLFMSGLIPDHVADTRWPFINKPFDLPMLVQVVDAMVTERAA